MADEPSRNQRFDRVEAGPSGDIPCPACRQLNEREREVCWACGGLLSGKKSPATNSSSAAATPAAENAAGAAPEDGLAAALRAELGAGERLLWTGNPGTSLRLDLWYIPGALGTFLFGSFGVWMLSGMIRAALSGDRAAAPISLLAIPFAAIAVFGPLSPFISRRQRASTIYGVTDRRAIRLRLWPWRWVRSVDLSGLARAYYRRRRDGLAWELVFARTWIFGEVFNEADSFDFDDPPGELPGIVIQARNARI